MTDSPPRAPEGTQLHAGAADAPRWLRVVLRMLALSLGALHTAMAVRSQSMNEDGIGYLDLGDAWLQGDWPAAINTTWSPLYALIVGSTVNATRPSVWWEFPTVQIVNFAIYGVALLCFEFFWRQLSRRYYAGDPGEAGGSRLPRVLWHAIGYSLFIYASLNLIEIWAVTPDMCVAAFVYVAAGQLLKLELPGATSSTALRLGIVLGAGYLAKAALFPLGLVCIALATILHGSALTRWARLGLSLGAFLIVAAPLVGAISTSVGHLSFSDVSRFTYLKHVNLMPWPNWHDARDRIDGTPLHPPRQVHDVPAVWEFATPIKGTYPLAYDPAWWSRGLEPRIAPGPQLHAMAANAVYYFELFVREQGGFLSIVLLLVVLSLRLSGWVPHVGGALALVLWALAAFGMYGLVYAEARYIAPFVVLFWSGALAHVRFPTVGPVRELSKIGGVLLVLFVWVNIGALNLEGLSGVVGFTPQQEQQAAELASSKLRDGQAADHPAIASALHDVGLKDRASVGFIGYAYSAYWARLARLRIVAEIRPEDASRFWSADPRRQADVLEAFRASGAEVVVAEPPLPAAPPEGWSGLGKTGFLVYRLQ